MAVGREGLMPGRLEGGELAFSTALRVLRHDLARCLEPFLDRIARKTCGLCDLPEGELVTQLYTPELANHVHGDHLVSLLKVQQVGGIPWKVLDQYLRSRQRR